MMKRLLLASVLALSLGGCLGTSVDTPAKAGIVFCNTYVGAVSTLANMARIGALSRADIERIDVIIDSIQPHCVATVPGAPTVTLEGALQTLLDIQIARQLENANRKSGGLS